MWTRPIDTTPTRKERTDYRMPHEPISARGWFWIAYCAAMLAVVALAYGGRPLLFAMGLM